MSPRKVSRSATLLAICMVAVIVWLGALAFDLGPFVTFDLSSPNLTAAAAAQSTPR